MLEKHGNVLQNYTPLPMAVQWQQISSAASWQMLPKWH